MGIAVVELFCIHDDGLTPMFHVSLENNFCSLYINIAIFEQQFILHD